MLPTPSGTFENSENGFSMGRRGRGVNFHGLWLAVFDLEGVNLRGRPVRLSLVVDASEVLIRGLVERSGTWRLSVSGVSERAQDTPTSPPSDFVAR